MERQRYLELRRWLGQAQIGHRSDPRCKHSDATIIQLLLWSALHNRSIDWATKRAHWPSDLRPRVLPSQSCMSRRLRAAGVWRLLERYWKWVRERLPQCDLKLIDGRPLPVGGCSKDPDAKNGYGAGHLIRGYKLHVISDWRGAVDVWAVAPLNVAETHVANRLIEYLPAAAYVLGDPNYDANHLYDRAGQRGTQWLAPPPKNAKGVGHQRQSPWRLRVQQWLRSQNGKDTMMRHRVRIEQVNAWQGCAEVGLSYLPHHVRTLPRVQLWVAIKMVIYHHWLLQRRSAVA